MKPSPLLVSLLQAIGLILYVLLVATIIQNGPPGFAVNPVFGIATFLTLFVLSALISASIILGYPLLLFLDGKRKLAVSIVIGSAAWLLLFFLSGFLILTF